jgi:uncharacterized integral membrane protein
MSGVTGTLSELTGRLPEDQAARGRHKLPTDRPTEPLIPTQKVPTHETVEAPEVVTGVVEVDESAEAVAEVATEVAEDSAAVDETSAPADEVLPRASLPTAMQWKASHGPRIVAAVLLLLAVAGTSALGLRYTETHSTDEFIYVVLGIGAIVGLWALLIASTPQVVSLRGSILTVRNSSGTERFDLADALQPVDVVGEPRTSQWALLLHRGNSTPVVLRRRDVDAAALDPIVRHYRVLAEQRFTDRQVRFSR